METNIKTVLSASFCGSVSCPWRSTKEALLRALSVCAVVCDRVRTCDCVGVCVCVWFTGSQGAHACIYMHAHARTCTHTHTQSLKKAATDQAAREGEALLDSRDAHSVPPASLANSASALCPGDLWGTNV